MSTFQVTVYPIAISEHPNADAIEIAVIGGYRSVVKKGQFREGDLVAYIPEGAVVPEAILAEMGLTGKLAGSAKNRVKALRLRGQLSQGICYPARPGWEVGQDVQQELGISKYVPPIPTEFAGQIANVGQDNILGYDIENWKKFPDILQEGEPVVFCEKIHGTFTCVGVLPSEIEGHGDVVVCSKGLGQQGLAFKMNAENSRNIYVRVTRALSLDERIKQDPEFPKDQPVYLFGETFGVQDLRYGAKTDRDETIGFRVFDIYIGTPRRGRFLNDAELDAACDRLGVQRVPVLWRGPFSVQAMEEYTDGRETVSGQQLHIREGIVIRPQVERQDHNLPVNGRVQLKSVSANYLLRKGSKGEEPTEME